ncbi:MAG: ACP S-malonyltransferase [Pseudomonadota bacterium]
MTLSLTFPGQGSQSVGMGKKLAETFPEARAVFEEVDAALSQNLSTLMFDGPEDELTLTANAQPALMAVSMAVVRVLEANGFDVGSASFAAGHSLGEYAAHAAVGTFSLADTARLLRIRGDAMQAAVPVGEGAMAAIIGLQASDVAALCEEASASGVCQIANDNGGGQLVISGAKAPVEAAAEAAKGKGAKRALMLPVSAPFHSALMAPAANAMREALGNVTVNTPKIPVVTNVNVAPTSNPAQIVEDLVNQVTGQVRWRETVEWFAQSGVITLAEIGSGKVLTGLARRINRELSGVAIGTPADIEAFLEARA